nr:patatin-like phospholipase family protein [Hoyosella rhizosphaerae]
MSSATLAIMAKRGVIRIRPGDGDENAPEALGFDPESLDDVVEAPEDVSLPSRNPVLALQHMEAALARGDVEHPEVLTRREFRELRYLVSFARLTVFEPGAAGPGGSKGRGDVDVTDEVRGFRARVLSQLHDALRTEPDTKKRLINAKQALPALKDHLDEARESLVERFSNDFSREELDAEVGYKALVCVMGGGGGAGYVYLGGMRTLVENDLTPDYMLTTSFGSIVGSVVARSLPVPVDDYIDWAKTVTYRGILGKARLRRRHGLTGLFSLHFDQFADDLFRREDGEPMQLRDLDIPFETVVAGVRKQSFDRLPARFRRTELDALRTRTMPRTRWGIGNAVAARMWQAAAFFDTRVVKPIVLGADDLTAGLNVVDAASFSSAIPGVLHHESSDPRMVPLLDELMAVKDVGALIDGVAASNVPIELAWRRVQDGRLGTRNACFYGWDCFHPQWNPKHLWMAPITQSIQVQMVRNAPYADCVVRFSPTLSALTLAASSDAMDRSIGWGAASVRQTLPMIKRLTEPVWWDGDGPPKVMRGPVTITSESRPRARSMSKVLARTRAVAARLSDKARRNRTDMFAPRPRMVEDE